MQKPSVGRIIHYVSYGTPKGEYQPAHRAAIITDVKSTENDDATTSYEIRCTIFNPDGQFLSPWLKFDEEEKASGTVHWPERE